MKISIITICYNSEKTIEQTINSVLNQSYENLEYIIIDGKSSDGTLAIIEKYRANISTVLSEKDKGLYDALNKGIEISTGEVIGFLHSDDVLFSNFTIESIAQAFFMYKCHGVYGDLIYTYKNDTNKIVRYWKSSKFNPEKLKKGWMPPHPTLFLKRSVYEGAGNFSLQYKISSDYDFMCRIFNNSSYNFIYKPEVITKMRMGGASNASLKHILNKSKEDYHIIRRNRIGGIVTLFLKNFGKLNQFIKRSSKF